MKPVQKMILLALLVFSFDFCSETHSEHEIWYCPMHTNYTSDRPGKCPICNMDLVQKKKEKTETKKNETVEENSLFLSNDKEALIGIKTEKVEFRNLIKKFSTSGSVAYDPELYAAILEYREAIRNSKLSEEEDVSSDALLRSGKIRLKQMGLSDSMIKEWSHPDKDISFFIAGGKYGKSLIYSQAYESDISLIKPGQDVEVKSSAFPGKIFKGKVKAIDIIVDSKNRTLRVRSIVDDRMNLLKPQMYADVEIISNLGQVLAIPKSAVMDTGKKQIVYVKINNSRFSPRLIKTGRETDDFYEVLHGLKPNEEIVVSANFLLDSEAKLKLGDIAPEHKH